MSAARCQNINLDKLVSMVLANLVYVGVLESLSQIMGSKIIFKLKHIIVILYQGPTDRQTDTPTERPTDFQIVHFFSPILSDSQFFFSPVISDYPLFLFTSSHHAFVLLHSDICLYGIKSH